MNYPSHSNSLLFPNHFLLDRKAKAKVAEDAASKGTKAEETKAEEPEPAQPDMTTQIYLFIFPDYCSFTLSFLKTSGGRGGGGRGGGQDFGSRDYRQEGRGGGGGGHGGGGGGGG